MSAEKCNNCFYSSLLPAEEPCFKCVDASNWKHPPAPGFKVEALVNSGLNGNYYEVQIDHPTKDGKEPYLAECNDITEALHMTPHEYNIFKSVWRKAAARLGNGKEDSKALYDAQKCLFASQRMVKLEELRSNADT